MTRLSALCSVLVVLLGASFSRPVDAQVATGTPQFGTFSTPGPDVINIGNLNMLLNIPVLNKAGRGIPMTYNLAYNSSVWYPVVSGSTTSWTPVQQFGWQGLQPAGQSQISYQAKLLTETCVDGSHEVVYEEWLFPVIQYVDPTGTRHSFDAGLTFISGSVDGAGNCPENSTPGSATSFVATDGSGYTATVIPGDGVLNISLTNSKGTKITAPIVANSQDSEGTSSLIDSNGNEITVSDGLYTDTTGTVALSVLGTAPSNTVLSYPTTTGSSANYTVSYQQYTVQTAFGCSGVSEYGATSMSLPHTITLPDSSIYQFTYEATPGVSGSVTGRIASVTLPSGGVISYAYTGGSNGIVCADGSTAGLTRMMQATASSPASTWTYTRTPGTPLGPSLSAVTSQTAVVDGLGNNQVYTFVNQGDQSGDYIETQRTIYQGAASGTPLLSRQTCYNGLAPPSCSGFAPSASGPSTITRVDTYEAFNGMAMHGSTAIYGSFGLQTESEIYDYGTTTARGPLLREENWTYDATIPSLVTSDLVEDGSGNPAGETLYTYDGSTPTVSSGVPQHVGVTGVRGNLTSVQQFASSGTSYTTTMTYEDTGTVLSVTAPTGITTLSYDSTFTYATGWTPPTPSSGVSQPGSGTYDTANTGLPLSTTDANGAKTSVASYDSFWRPTEVDSFNSGNTQLAKSTASYTQNLIQQNTFQNASTSGETQTELDAYGRVSRGATSNGQSTNPWYQQDTCYDANGNTSFVSTRYQGAGFSASKVCTSAGNTFSYDALGRVLSVQHADGTSRSYTYTGRATRSVDESGVIRISQVDGLGRLTIVCEISSNSSMPNSGSPVACGTDIMGTGFTTTYAYALATPTTTVTQGAQTRTFQTDWLGRTTSVTEPERGNTSYSYAYNSTGLVVTRTRPTANQTSPTTLTTTTTQYDSLGRVTSVSYSDGTPTKTYKYDVNANFGSGFVQTNYIGRLSVATAITPGNFAATVFSYDGLGRVIGLDECLPVGCGTSADNLSLSYQYDLAGNMLSSSDGAGTTTTYTYSPANEVQSVTSSLNTSEAPPAIISNVTNGPFGPLNYRLGNGLTSVATYDALGRVNGSFVCDGSTSASCSGGSEIYGYSVQRQGVRTTTGCDTVLNNCANFGYDESNRLTSRTVTSGTAQNFTYGYDRYGNRLSQTAADGGPGPQLTISSTTNRITSAGYSYDAAGNVTSDGFHTYTYDAEGNLTAVDGGSTASYMYNALNQRVSATAGGTTTQYAYNVAGQRVSIWNTSSPPGQIVEEYYVGNKHVGYYANSMLHFHHTDWTGTERVRTMFNGTVEATFTSLPFGDAFALVSGSDGDPYHYALQDHDFTSDTDHAQFRQYSSTPGRWMSPDPYDGSYDPSNPQSFNRYSYVLNNPESFIDPNGLVSICYDINTFESSDGNGGVIYHYTTVCSDQDSGSGSGSGSLLPGGAGGPGGTSAPNNTENPPPCQAKILSATNNQFGTNYTDANVSSTFNYSTGAGPGQGTLNLNITGSTAGVSPGYYPVHWYSYIIGYGPTLHVVSGPGGNGGLDSQMTVPFGPNQGTFHIDSAFPHNPFGAIIHGIMNMTKLAGYPKC